MYEFSRLLGVSTSLIAPWMITHQLPLLSPVALAIPHQYSFPPSIYHDYYAAAAAAAPSHQSAPSPSPQSSPSPSSSTQH
mmetsp:Transcript_10094/g.15274  ORF Transcript_10094/g.15274 Transcript_10094/m.15274 type:complete len:80 (-) Transcript_10094:249-488(-)